ncbi:MAG: hypothetical protein OEY23_12675 [Acidimicrobiia bacterium]|nr:hypothetical protein [Acidimicrobiia bacterium]
MSGAGAEDLWVVLPAGQRADGGWLDDTLALRNAEAGLRSRAPSVGDFPRQRVELFRGPGAHDALGAAFAARGWTDGLPVVPPSTDKVADLVAVSGRPPQYVLGTLAPLGGQATVEKVAANAVMAGCGLAQFPFVVAAVEAVADPAFNLRGVQTTDENCAPLIVVSAPAEVRAAAEIHAGIGLLGPGWRGNATIGRALRLVMHNLGGGWPGAVSFAGAGQPGRYTLCVAEDDEACPWPPLRVELGFAPEDTVVVVTRAETAVNVTGGLAEIADVMGSATSLFTIVHRGVASLLVAPHVAAESAARGWSRRDLAAHLVERARLSERTWAESWVADRVRQARGKADADPAGSAEHAGGVDDPVVGSGSGDAGEGRAVLASPDDLVLFVAGGRIPIPQHVWFPSWGFPPCKLAVRVHQRIAP